MRAESGEGTLFGLLAILVPEGGAGCFDVAIGPVGRETGRAGRGLVGAGFEAVVLTVADGFT